MNDTKKTTNETTLACPRCGCERLSFLSIEDEDRSVGYYGTVQVTRCLDCGLLAEDEEFWVEPEKEVA